MRGGRGSCGVDAAFWKDKHRGNKGVCGKQRSENQVVVASIDIKDGEVVQLRQGREKVLARDDAEALAKEFDLYGEVAVIDLDGAMGGRDNSALIASLLHLCEARVGGGIRDIKTAEAWISRGAKKIIAGSKAFTLDDGSFGVNRAWLEALGAAIGRERVVVAVDAREGKIVVNGWKTNTGLELIRAAREIAPLAGELLFTCVEREGMMGGTDLSRVRELKKAIAREADPTTRLTVAGGVSTLDEIREISEAGADVQLGMALYTGKINLAEAFVESLAWKKAERDSGGLLPVIAQAEDGLVLMQAYADREAVLESFRRGSLCFHSRTRNALWMKGQNSGHTLRLKKMRADCDRDSILAAVSNTRGVCHTGAWTCYGTDRSFAEGITHHKERTSYLNKRTASLSPYVAGEQPEKGELFIKLNTNENPYPPSPRASSAWRAAFDDSLRLYPDPACVELRRTFAEKLNLKSENIIFGNGSDEILAFIFAAFFENDAGKGALPVLFPDITYSFYPVYAGLWEAPYREVALQDDFSININDYFFPNGGIVIANPNAPTGLLCDKNKLLRLVEYNRKIKRVVVIDEAYIDFADSGRSASLVDRINEYDNLIVVRTLSKGYSLAGLRVGAAIGCPELIEGIGRVRDSFNSYLVDRIAQNAASAALSDTEYYDRINAKVIDTRNRVTRELQGSLWNVLPSSANFIFASPPSGHRLGCAKDIFANLKSKKILVRHFNKNRIDNFLRISIGLDSEMDILLKELI
jgi:histidinol-phosphate aminotransferase